MNEHAKAGANQAPRPLVCPGRGRLLRGSGEGQAAGQPAGPVGGRSLGRELGGCRRGEALSHPDPQDSRLQAGGPTRPAQLQSRAPLLLRLAEEGQPLVVARRERLPTLTAALWPEGLWGLLTAVTLVRLSLGAPGPAGLCNLPSGPHSICTSGTISTSGTLSP